MLGRRTLLILPLLAFAPTAPTQQASSAAPQSASTAPCPTIPLDASDAVTASPANHTVLFENADIRVLDVHSQPHTREAVHTHRLPSVMYVDRQGAGTYNTPDGKDNRSHPTDPNFKPRIVAIKPEGPHWTENTGDVPFHAIRVEFKHPGCGLPGWKPTAPGPDDALIAAPESHTLLLENDEVRVLDVHLPPHGKDPMHTSPWPGVFYIIDRAPLRGFSPAGPEPGVINFPPGVEIMPAKAGAHSLENLGDTPLHLIRFELKHAQ